MSTSLPLGTRRTHRDGYLYVKTEKGWLGYHTDLAERLMGRPLNPGEHVHHINGDKQDNRTVNLHHSFQLSHSYEQDLNGL